MQNDNEGAYSRKLRTGPVGGYGAGESKTNNSSGAGTVANNNNSRTSRLPAGIQQQQIYKFSLARSFVCHLPGDLIFFSSNLPKPSTDIQSYITDNAVVISQQFGPTPPRRITLVKIDALGNLTEVNYVGLDYVEFRNLSQLPGLHEAYLNNAVHAHRRGLIEDWIEYFRKDWTTAIFLHSFPRLIQSLRTVLASDRGMINILNRVIEKSEITVEDSEMSEYRRSMFGAHGELVPELTRKLISTETYEFVKDNREFIPKFYVPNANANSNGATNGDATATTAPADP